MKARGIRSIAVLATVVCVVPIVGGCGGGDSADDRPVADETGNAAVVVIATSIPQASDPTLQIEADALKAEAGGHDMEVVQADANLDLNKQISDIDSFIQQKVDAIVAWPLDSKSIEPAFARATDAGIAVIARQTPTEASYDVNLQADDYLSGVQAAEYLARELGPGAKVAAIIGPQQVDSFRDLAQGFADGARENGLDVVDTQTNQDLAPEASATFARNWQQEYGDELRGIFDSLDATALAVAAVANENFDPLIVTYGGSDEALDAVRDGRFAALLYQYSVVNGRASAWAAAKAIAGETLPKTIYLPQPLIDQQNIDDYPPSAEQLAEPMSFSIETVDGKDHLEFEHE